MPSYAGVLSESQVQSLILFIKSLGGIIDHWQLVNPC
jgi:hypothetical protein